MGVTKLHAVHMEIFTAIDTNSEGGSSMRRRGEDRKSENLRLYGQKVDAPNILLPPRTFVDHPAASHLELNLASARKVGLLQHVARLYDYYCMAK